MGKAAKRKVVGRLRKELIACLEPDDPANLPRIRDIGEELNQLGGRQLMYSVADSLPREYQRTVDVAWHGIGGWIS